MASGHMREHTLYDAQTFLKLPFSELTLGNASLRLDESLIDWNFLELAGSLNIKWARWPEHHLT